MKLIKLEGEEENNALKSQNEELSRKLRRNDALLIRVKEELAKECARSGMNSYYVKTVHRLTSQTYCLSCFLKPSSTKVPVTVSVVNVVQTEATNIELKLFSELERGASYRVLINDSIPFILLQQFTYDLLMKDRSCIKEYQTTNMDACTLEIGIGRSSKISSQNMEEL
ncbi:kinesin motor domain-containing protein [Artemisia annua]|uniref:Kinesin motor domain-containing protein n=1 Tax=Artemisia annua TaxID=35608 RepID=A0A2U1LJP0_ARTAN|nr:kinesin motor domain-containing protein [Artemisia annua]